MATEPPSNNDDALDALANKIAAAEKIEDRAFSHPDMSGSGNATHVFIEFTAPIIVGAVLGVWLDKHFSILPVCTLIFILLGLGTGIMNVLRLSKKLDTSSEDNTP